MSSKEIDTKIKNAAWFKSETTRSLLDLLGDDKESARVVGGAVRNTLLGESVVDIDIATALSPTEVTERAQAKGYSVHPTGIDHGTVTLVTPATDNEKRQQFEVTTLRRDVKTDGRHAVVEFTTDWVQDAMRRDFTMNALYVDADGHLHDPVDGLQDCLNRNIRFIGAPEDRIREDYLRIMRFFRFFARFGEGRPDAEGLKTCARLKSGLKSISAERIWSELKALLAAKDPSRAILWMRTVGVLSEILPENGNYGTDMAPAVPLAETRFHWQSDPLRRLMAILPPRDDRIMQLVKRLKLSNAEKDRLLDWATTNLPAKDMTQSSLEKEIYLNRKSGVGLRDQIEQEIIRRLAYDGDKAEAVIGLRAEQRHHVSTWQCPEFPVSGSDLVDAGSKAGPKIGAELKKLEENWIESGFSLSKEELIKLKS